MSTRLLLLAFISSLLSGCNYPVQTIQLESRSPVAVAPDVDRILNDWQKRRSTSTSIYAKFKQTVKGESRRNQYEFGTVLKAVNFRPENAVVVRAGAIRCLPNLGRLDFHKDENGKGRETFLWTKNKEYWQIRANDRQAQILEFNTNVLGNTPIFDYLQATPFVWFVPAEKSTLQKHGTIRKVSEDARTIVLRVENVKREYDREDGYESLTVHLRKPDLLPTKLIVTESKECEVTWEFTEVHENLDLSDSDFIPPKLDSTWKITRQKLQSDKQPKSKKSKS